MVNATALRVQLLLRSLSFMIHPLIVDVLFVSQSLRLIKSGLLPFVTHRSHSISAAEASAFQWGPPTQPADKLTSILILQRPLAVYDVTGLVFPYEREYTVNQTHKTDGPCSDQMLKVCITFFTQMLHALTYT